MSEWTKVPFWSWTSEKIFKTQFGDQISSPMGRNDHPSVFLLVLQLCRVRNKRDWIGKNNIMLESTSSSSSGNDLLQTEFRPWQLRHVFGSLILAEKGAFIDIFFSGWLRPWAMDSHRSWEEFPIKSCIFCRKTERENEKKYYYFCHHDDNFL